MTRAGSATARALIVDDERPARERLRKLLTRDSRVEIAGCCAGGDEALDVLRAASRAGTPVQLMFLDVQMPEVDGFGVLSALVRDRPPVPMPAVVFVTASTTSMRCGPSRRMRSPIC